MLKRSTTSGADHTTVIIYMPPDSRPAFGTNSELCDVQSVKAYPEYEVTLTARTLAR